MKAGNTWNVKDASADDAQQALGQRPVCVDQIDFLPFNYPQ
jgi:hypothetical protein